MFEFKLPDLRTGIPIFRRKGGGCSVFLDPGNLIVSVVFPAKGFLRIQTLFNRASQWLIEGLKKGLKNANMTTLYQDGISDIVINNKKVGGSCFHRAKGIAYFSTSILVSADQHLMQQYLQIPPREPEYRKGRSHTNFTTTLDIHFKNRLHLMFNLCKYLWRGFWKSSNFPCHDGVGKLLVLTIL